MPDKQAKRRINGEIRSQKVLLIGVDGNRVGVIDTQVAIRLAREAGLDLVEMSSNSNPPIAKIADYSKIKYEEQRKEKRAHQQARDQEVKAVRFRAVTDEHDLEIKRKQVTRWLEKGSKVKLTIQLKGRERRNTEPARVAIKTFIDSLSDYGELNGRISVSNGVVSAQLNPLPEHKRKRTTADRD